MLREISRLYNESKMSHDYIIKDETIGDMFMKKFIGRTEEAVALMLGDAKYKMIYFDIIAKGSINSSNVPIRRIVDLALRHNAKSVYIAHNHPSGSAMPSSRDIDTTIALKDTLDTVGVKLNDHFIITTDDYVSIRDSMWAGKIFVHDD